MQHRTQACLYFGRAIASEDYLRANPTGFQDALTDPSDNKWFFLNVALLIAMLVYYFTISWVFLLIGVANIFLMSVVVGLFSPKVSSEKYLLKIIKSLTNRVKKYESQGDALRGNLAKDLIEKLEKFKASN
jgi:hypothetical protein